MRYARIQDGAVAEIITLPDGVEPDDAFHADIAADLVACADVSVVVGSTTADGGKTFALPPAIHATATVPTSVSSAQAKIQCLRTPGAATGKTLLDDITAAVQASGGEVAIWFEEARTWQRSNPYVASLSSGLKLTSAQVDQLFIAAAQISA